MSYTACVVSAACEQSILPVVSANTGCVQAQCWVYVGYIVFFSIIIKKANNPPKMLNHSFNSKNKYIHTYTISQCEWYDYLFPIRKLFWSPAKIRYVTLPFGPASESTADSWEETHAHKRITCRNTFKHKTGKWISNVFHIMCIKSALTLHILRCVLLTSSLRQCVPVRQFLQASYQ